ncbi:MAG TPA: 50S ribosomal protein L19 [Verrucomicrobiae bacterium]|nr:50S ribosomal protein L19 [Verrucomicrobiae bacterium]
MINRRARVRRARVTRLFVADDDVEKQRFARPRGNRVADDANLAAIPAGRPGDGVFVAVKVQEIERQRLNAFVGQVLFHRGADFRQIIFVQHLVGFEIKRPVAGAIVERDGFLLAKDKTLHGIVAAEMFVPGRRDDADF